MSLRTRPASIDPAVRRGSDRLSELARRRALAANVIRPGLVIPAIIAVLAVAAIHWWLFTGGTWTGHPTLTTDFASQADSILRYTIAPAPAAQPLLHGSGPAVLLVPFQWAVHRGYLDQPISDQCLLLMFTWGITALVARWLCRLHTLAAPDSPVSVVVAGTLLGSLAVPWPSILIHPDSNATAIAVAAFFFVAGLYILWSNRCTPIPHLSPLLLTSVCWILAAASSPILLPAIIMTAVLTSPFALPRRKHAPFALFTIIAPMGMLTLPALQAGNPGDWHALAISHLHPNFRHLLAVPLAANWREVFTSLPRLRTVTDLDPSILLWQLPLYTSLLFTMWGLLRSRKHETMERGSEHAPTIELLVQNHDPDRVLITPRKVKGSSLSYTLAIDAGLSEKPTTRISPHGYPVEVAPSESGHLITPAMPVSSPREPSNIAPPIGPFWLPLTLLAAIACITFCALLLPVTSAPAFALTTHAAVLLLAVTWWPFLARHKTRPAFRLALAVGFALCLLTACASYLSITLVPA